MKILLLRHGPAVDRDDPTCPPDAERPLTARGVARTRAALTGLARLDVRPRRVATSPSLRALQTAELAVELLGCDVGEIECVQALAPGGDAREVLDWLARRDGRDDLALVGHLPQLDLLLALLVGSPLPVSRLKKAGAAWLDLHAPQPGGARLDFLATPRMLRALGDA
ncbi:MAG: histidine phosphatase family protein [Planctomycetes bacterium]|nr:histidine phosphatase family protein [Planctomycetota bacterium]